MTFDQAVFEWLGFWPLFVLHVWPMVVWATCVLGFGLVLWRLRR